MAEQRMSATLTRLARKRGRLPALVTAALIAALLLAQSLLNSLVGPLASNLLRAPVLLVEDAPAATWDPVWVIQPFLLDTVPFCVGVFISLWMLAPIAAQLTVRFVVTRGLLATLSGALVMLVVGVFVQFFLNLGGGFDGTALGVSLIGVVQGVIGVVIFRSPVVVLAAILLWLWLRDHPREYEVAGLIDEL